MTSTVEIVPNSVRSSQPSSSSWNPFQLFEKKAFKAYYNLEATFALAMLEPWEVILVFIVVTILSTLFGYSLYYYFPIHIRFLFNRTHYYLYGNNPTTHSFTAHLPISFKSTVSQFANQLLDVFKTHSASGKVEL